MHAGPANKPTGPSRAAADTPAEWPQWVESGRSPADQPRPPLIDRYRPEAVIADSRFFSSSAGDLDRTAVATLHYAQAASEFGYLAVLSDSS
jgi:hypothetical protein